MIKAFIIHLAVLSFFFSSFLFANFSAAANPEDLNDKLVPKDKILLGSNEILPDVEQQMGRPFDIAHYYVDWNADFPNEEQQKAVDKGSILYINWEPRNYEKGTFIPWKEIAEGKHDTRIDQVAQQMKKFNKKLFISFACEPDMTLDKQGTPKDFAAAFRHVVERFRSHDVKNVVWVWNISGWKDYYDSYKNGFYPGDDVVDWIGWDPYNWYRCKDMKWQSFTKVVTPFYQFAEENGFADKPLMLSEFGSSEKDGDAQAKANWLRSIPKEMKNFPKINAIVYFNYIDQETGCKWRIDSSPESQKGFVDFAKELAKTKQNQNTTNQTTPPDSQSLEPSKENGDWIIEMAITLAKKYHYTELERKLEQLKSSTSN